MEIGYFMFFFKILNIRTWSGPDTDLKNYGYFIGIIIIDPNRSGSEKNRIKSESELKIYKYLLKFEDQSGGRKHNSN